MLAKLMRLVRLAAAALLLGFVAAPVAEAGVRATSAKTAEAAREKRPADPEAGLAWIAGAVALFVFMAWVAVRMNDHPRPADKVPN